MKEQESGFDRILTLWLGIILALALLGGGLSMFREEAQSALRPIPVNSGSTMFHVVTGDAPAAVVPQAPALAPAVINQQAPAQDLPSSPYACGPTVREANGTYTIPCVGNFYK